MNKEVYVEITTSILSGDNIECHAYIIGVTEHVIGQIGIGPEGDACLR